MPLRHSPRRASFCASPVFSSARRVWCLARVGATVAATMAAIATHAQTYVITTLAAFNNTNGASPLSTLTLDRSGNLYGTTQAGGSNNDGTVFKIAARTHTLTTLATFNGTNGEGPQGNLTLDRSGNLYGTTTRGGASKLGTVFKIASGTNTLTTLATFVGSNGAFPKAGLTLDGSGNLYGTTTGGNGGSEFGTVFKIAAGTRTLTTLATFNGINDNGANPSGLTLDSSGNLYGTTEFGGASGKGTVFEVSAGTNTINTIVTFNGTTIGAFPNGANPEASLTLDASGNLYGTTLWGGASKFGTVFKIAARTHTLTTLATFNGTNDVSANPSGLTLDGSGNLYGTSNQGSGTGTVFKIASGTHALTALTTFKNTNGAGPYAGLTLDGSGNLYGTTVNGGERGVGTVFKLTSIRPATTR